jgi:hypothetical protein
VFADRGDVVIAFVELAQSTGDQEAVSQFDAASAGEVVVAAARFGQRGHVSLLAEGADRGSRGREQRQGFQRGGNLSTGEFVVAMSALGPDAEQTAVDKPAQVDGGGGRGHPGTGGELTSRARAPVG